MLQLQVQAKNRNMKRVPTNIAQSSNPFMNMILCASHTHTHKNVSKKCTGLIANKFCKFTRIPKMKHQLHHWDSLQNWETACLITTK